MEAAPEVLSHAALRGRGCFGAVAVFTAVHKADELRVRPLRRRGAETGLHALPEPVEDVAGGRVLVDGMRALRRADEAEFGKSPLRLCDRLFLTGPRQPGGVPEASRVALDDAWVVDVVDGWEEDLVHPEALLPVLKGVRFLRERVRVRPAWRCGKKT